MKNPAHPEFLMATLDAFVGRELGVSSWCLVDQARIDVFAQCTLDTQWIHVDVARAARESPFGRTIAHGYLTLSLAASLGIEVGLIPRDASSGLNYGLDKVRFMTPVKAGSRVRNHVELLGIEDKGGGRKLVRVKNTLEIEGEAKPALVAESLVLLVGSGS